MDKFVRRHWLATASVLAIIVTLSISQMLLIQKNRELERQRDLANTAAETSENVTAFLLDIFRAANPANADGGKLTARELLDRGRQRIAADESLPADVRFRLTFALAKAYGSLSLITESTELYEQAHELYRESGIHDPAIEFELLSGLGHWMSAAERDETARAYLEAALRVAPRVPEIPPRRVTGVRGMLAHLEMKLGNFEQAQIQTESLYEEMRARFGIRNRATLRAGAMLANIYTLTANFDATRGLLAQLAPAAENLTGADSGYSYGIRQTLGELYYALGRREDAERALRPVYEHYLEQVGPDAIFTQSVVNEYALTLADNAAAVRMLEDAVARQREQYGNDAPILVDTLQNLAIVYLRIPGRESQAERCLREARMLSERISGTRHLATRSVYFELAKVHSRTGRLESAVELLKKTGDIPIYQYEAAHSEDFAMLRDNPDFVAFLGRFGDDRPDLP